MLVTSVLACDLVRVPEMRGRAIDNRTQRDATRVCKPISEALSKATRSFTTVAQRLELVARRVAQHSVCKLRDLVLGRGADGDDNAAAAATTTLRLVRHAQGTLTSLPATPA